MHVNDTADGWRLVVEGELCYQLFQGKCLILLEIPVDDPQDLVPGPAA